MTERPQRFILCLIAVAMTVAITMKSHGVSRLGDPVAFLPEGTTLAGKETIGIRGCIRNPGVYQFTQDMELNTVTNMTLTGVRTESREKLLAGHDIHTGDVLEIIQKDRDHIEIKKEKMTISEKMILGISLDPNQLTAEDWEKLPGIGPITAAKIITDRQNNGAFYSIGELKRVSGIGQAKINQLKQFFE